MDLSKEIVDIANKYESETGTVFYHLNNHMGSHRYVRDAFHIKSLMKPDAVILDIGCGHGQMSYLLRRLGLKVVASDIKSNIPYYINHFNVLMHGDIEYRRSNILQKEDKAFAPGEKFDAICISGVLEHVSDLGVFLSKLKSMLVKNGKLIIFRFPNRYSWIEKINDIRFGISSDHLLRFSLREVHLMLRWHGFKIESSWYEQMLPVNMTNMPDGIAKSYHAAAFALIPISRFLCAIPLVNKLSTSFAFTCTKAWEE